MIFSLTEKLLAHHRHAVCFMALLHGSVADIRFWNVSLRPQGQNRLNSVLQLLFGLCGDIILLLGEWMKNVPW